jgi:hypothetical protein
VNALGVAGLTIEHFSQVGGNLEPGLAEPLERLNRVAVGIADELRLNLHVGQHVNFVAPQVRKRIAAFGRSSAGCDLLMFKPQSKAGHSRQDSALLACSAINQSTNC